MAVEAVFFDVGETLIDETRHWGLWADYMGVPRLTFFAVLGSLIEKGHHHREVFKIFDPDFDYSAAEQARKQAGETYEFLPSDFYPDAIPCLHALRQAGIRIGIAGNQPEACESALLKAGIEADIIASSAKWGVEKPSLEFFERVVGAVGLPARSIAYVGDRYDNDIEPAHRAGLIPIFIKRGPWAFLKYPKVELAQAQVSALSEIPDLLRTL